MAKKRQKLGLRASAALSVLGLLLLADTGIARAADITLPFRQQRLSNGLNVVVQEDHTLPLVAANLIYKVGARDEQSGKTGFAHLFEHLMFMGTKRAPTGAFDTWIERGGGSNNAWTSADYTDYYESGPRTLLPLFLWLEADRLETLGMQIDRPKLDLQRDVVRNERRQTIENVPYGKVELVTPELMYPADHPYHHPVIGSHADLEAATVGDVKAFFASHYVPSNASLVVAGDIDATQTFALAERDFGSIPAGHPPERAAPAAPPRLGRVVRETIPDRVELPKIVMAFHSPAHFAPGDAELDLLASILSSGKSSRLYRDLVYEKALAQSVEAEQESATMSSIFTVEVVVRPGVPLDKVEKEVDAILADATRRPPTDEELRRAKNEIAFSFVDRLQSLSARASQMNMYWAETGDPGFFNQDRARYERATAADVFAQAQKTLTLDERLVLRVVPNDQAPPAGSSPGAPHVSVRSSGRATSGTAAAATPPGSGLKRPAGAAKSPPKGAR